MNNLIVGTAGHIDHGKTELIKALTGVDTDRLKDEKLRGISIDLGFARFPMVDEEINLGVVDVPGHEAFIRNMVAGVTGIDLVLFVIAADEGVMPQTTEHLDILRFLEVKRGIVVITKADLVEEDWLGLVVDEIRGLIRGSFMEEAPVVITSVKNGRGLDELREKILEVAAKVEAKPEEDLFRLPIDRVFTIKGMGTVITGTIWSGSVKLDQSIIIQPEDKVTRVKAIQVHSKDRDRAAAGVRVALALSGLSRGEIQRGSTALQTGDWVPSMMIDVYLDYLPRAGKPLKNRSRIRFHLATQEVMGRIILLADEELSGGEGGYAQIRLEKPVITRRGDRFVLRSYSPLTTIGGGKVLVPYAPKRTTIDPMGHEHLAVLRSSGINEVILSLVRDHGLRGYPMRRLPIDGGFGPELISKALKEIGLSEEVMEVKGDLFHRSAVDEMHRKVQEGLEQYHVQNPLQQGVKRGELRHRIKGSFSDKLLDEVLSRLERDGTVDVTGGEVRLSSHKIVFRGGAGKQAGAILGLLSQEPLSPPDVTRIALELGVDKGELLKVLGALQKMGKVVKLDEGIWLVSDGVALAREKIESYLRDKGKATASEIRGLLKVSRKYVIPILEHMDRIGVTYRKGDYRFLISSR